MFQLKHELVPSLNLKGSDPTDNFKYVDSHFTANGFFGKISQQTGKVSQLSEKLSHQSGKVSQQFCHNNKIF